MKYAANIGGLGLDMHLTYSRDEVYGLRSSVSCTDSVPFNFMPEDDSYHVVNIVKGLCTAE